MGEQRTKVSTAHFHIFYEEADRDFGEKIVGRMEDFYAGMCRRAGLEPGEERYDLYVCGTAEDFRYYTGKSEEEYEDWMVGNADMEKKRLCVASPRVKGDFSREYEEYLIRVMLHETVHMVFDRLCPPEQCPIWLSEGIAVCLAEQTEDSCISERDCPEIKELGGSTDMNAFVSRGGYGYSGVYVWYLLERFGMEKFLSLYRGECSAEELLEEGFEGRAVRAYQAHHPHRIP